MAVSWDSNSISTLFSSLPSSGTSFFGTSSSTSANMLSDYYSIKNGSYGKLMKSYYAQNNSSSDSTKSTDKTNKSDAISKDNTKKATIAKDVKSAADTLKTSADNLLDSKLYDKVETTDKDGNKTEAVDTNKVFKAASDFVDSYNKMIENGSKSDSAAVKSNISAMNNYARVNTRALSEMGITIGSDNKMTIDEDKFKKADVEDVKDIFGKKGSFGYQVSSLASSVSSAASNSIRTGYTSTGNYSTASASSFYDAV